MPSVAPPQHVPAWHPPPAEEDKAAKSPAGPGNSLRGSSVQGRGIARMVAAELCQQVRYMGKFYAGCGPDCLSSMSVSTAFSLLKEA